MVYFAVVVSYIHAHSQDNVHSNAIGLNPIGITTSLLTELTYINLSYEKRISNKISLITNLEAKTYHNSHLYDFDGQSYAHLNITGYGVSPEFRYYLKENFKGFHFGCLISLWNAVEEYNDFTGYSYSYTDNGFYYGFMSNCGYKIGSRVAFNPSVSMGIAAANGLTRKERSMFNPQFASSQEFKAKIKLLIAYQF